MAASDAVAVGQRVVRGPDWKWQGQDGGEGTLGTVTGTRPGWAVVCWDGGTRGDYRVGADGKYDLRLFDNAPVGVLHRSVYCDGADCTQKPMHGIRWKCSECYDFDLCTDCFMRRRCHSLGHAFFRIDRPDDPWTFLPRRSECSPVSTKGIVPRAKVVRGPDWEWANQDGGVGRVGEVLARVDWQSGSGLNDAVRVKWQAGHVNTYRVGFHGKVDLKAAFDPPSYGYYYPALLPTLGLQEEQHSTSANTIRPGDSVVVSCHTTAEMKRLQDGHGGWNPNMNGLMGKNGRVTSILDNGDVRVEILSSGRDWVFNPAALTKVTARLKVGDTVRILSDVEKVKMFQKGHGDWADGMEMSCGRIGEVIMVYPDQDVRVRVSVIPGLRQQWTFNPACLQRVSSSGEEPSQGFSANGAQAFLKLLEELQGGGTNSRKEMLRAVSDGNARRVRQLIADKPELAREKSDDITPLHLAAYRGFKEVMEVLLDGGALPEVVDKDGDTALHLTAYTDQPICAKMLLQRGANCNPVNKLKRTPLHIAAAKGFGAVAHVYLANGADIHAQDNEGDSALHDAIATKHDEIVDLLLRFGANLLLANNSGFLPLHIAARRGNAAAVLKLLQNSPHLVNSRKPDGFTALHLAALNGNLIVAKVIIEQFDGDLNAVTSNNSTPLHLAVGQGVNSMVEFLVAAGAELNIQNDDGDTVLHIALKHHAAADGPGGDPMATLMASLGLREGQSQSTSKWLATACFLAHNGASLDVRNKKGCRPLDHCTTQVDAMKIKQFAHDSRKKSHSSPKKTPASPTFSDGIRVSGSSGTGSSTSASSGVSRGAGSSDSGIRVFAGESRSHATTSANDGIRVSGSTSSDGIRVRTVTGADNCDPIPVTALPKMNELSGSSTDNDVTMNIGPEGADSVSGGHPLCTLCDTLADLCFLPCTHISVCQGCGARAKKCSTCKHAVDQKVTLSTCLLCDSLACVLFKPCCHSTLCFECSGRAKKCSQCKVPCTEKWFNGKKL